MGEQFKLNLGGEAVPETPKKMGQEPLDETGLRKLYLEKVSVPPRTGRDSEEHLRWAIEHPSEELSALGEIDRAEDREEIDRMYGRKRTKR